MSDGLIVSGSGSTAVATDELYAAAQLLQRLATLATTLRADLAAIDGASSAHRLVAGGAPWSAVRAEYDLEQARAVMVEIELQAAGLAWALGVAAEGYGLIEAFIQATGISLSGEAASILGSLSPGTIITSPLFVSALAALTGAIAAALGARPEGSAGPHGANAIITNPATVSLVRGAVMSTDDAMMAAAGIPWPLALLVGDNGLGLVGLGFASATIARVGSSVGLVTETPVKLATDRPLEVSRAPTTFADRLARVPQPSAAEPAQVVVEKYTVPGQPDRFEVYIAGTVSFDPVAGSEPWDMTSNLANTAGEGGGAYASVVEAMRLAGVDESSPVQFTGYSQGGGVAARLAASEDYNTQGIATFGAPTGQIAIPAGIPAVLVEHTDDIVPAFGGTQENGHAVIVERAAFEGRDIPTDVAVPAHQLSVYKETARLMDDGRSTQVAGAAAQLAAFTAGATSVTSTAYSFERVSPNGEAVSGSTSGSR